MSPTAGVARTVITPFRNVELTGWGYYLERTWQRIHDDLHATALVVDDGSSAVVVISLDLMVVDTTFVDRVRSMIQAETGIPPAHVLVACTHTHSAPAAGGLLGAGETDPLYEEWAAKQAATAAVLAHREREPVTASVGVGDVVGHTFNRTRENGPVDTRLTTLRLDREDGSPLAVVVNFQAHPTIHTVLRPFDVTRDVPGEVCDAIESALPSATALYLQGACGDVNYHRAYSTPQDCHVPGRATADVALATLANSTPMSDTTVAGTTMTARLPTRRWTREEIEHDRSEAERRLAERDTSGWRETIGRVMVNRPDDMVRRHGGDEWRAVAAMCRFNMEWTERMLADLDERPEILETEAQALRIGDLCLAANASEFFTSLALDLRARCDSGHLMIAGYANGRIGYLPDAHDVERRTYAAYQSPKYCDQFPFTAESGPAMVDAMLAAIRTTRTVSATRTHP